MSEYTIATGSDSLRAERLLPGPLERVWSYLTDPQLRSQWLAGGEMELRPGGRVEHIFRNSELAADDDPAPAKYEKEAGEFLLHGRITVCEPLRTLAYTWGDDDSEVRFELTPRGEQVLLVVIHTRIANRDFRISAAAGWHTHLDILVARLEQREPDGFWRVHTRLEREYEARLPQ